jgi:hypothetical protein
MLKQCKAIFAFQLSLQEHFMRLHLGKLLIISLSSLIVLFEQSCGQAAIVTVTVTIENLSPANSASFAPLRLGFGNGTFDAFNLGQTAGNAIVSVAEGGSGNEWFPAFAAAEPNAVLGSVGGALTPGATASNTFTVDTNVNPYFTFGSMVIPSNDLFIGNDNPMEYLLFNSAGNLILPQILVGADEIWDANSEVADPLNAAFVVGGTNSLRTPENGVVAFDFSELNVFNGLTTADGYIFSNLLTNSSDVYRISFTAAAVPEPTSILLSAIGLTFAARRRRRS